MKLCTVSGSSRFLDVRLTMILLTLAAQSVLASGALAVAQEPTGAELNPNLVYWDQVRPVLQKRCFACHRGEQARGGFDLTSVAGVKAGSTSGAAVVSGKPEQSLLFTLPAHMENPQMPPSGNRIPQSELDLISGWITGGLAERTIAASAGTSSAEKKGISISVNTRRPGQAVVKSSETGGNGYPSDSDPPVLPIRIRSRSELTHGTDHSLPGLPADIAPVTAMAVSPTATILAVPGRKRVMLIDWESGEQTASLPFPEGDVFSLKFSTDGSLLMMAGGQGAASKALVICRVDTGERIFESNDDGDAILAADLSPSGRHAVFGGPERTVQIIDTIESSPGIEIRKHTDWVLATSFSPDGILVATGDRFGAVYVWETSSGEEFHTLRGHTGTVQSLHWNNEGDQLITAGHDGTIRTWNIHDGRQMSLVQTSLNGILCSAVTPDFATIYAGGRNGSVGCFRNDQTTGWTTKMDDEVVQISLTHDGRSLLAADVVGNLRVLDSVDGHVIRSIQLPAANP